ncbi:DUF3343 domain-containing protein [Peptostreptococcus equinus]|uniref:DUF3343 domain-containing protein n=1 Tax=Peptostreptococcus equinus TaxID=3003601 RepID=A0ABY7JKY4_9FIRM|nr:DUF3343 domain-containing protein [Peptostreptococcus sp. CBA3647]WAW14008.1 DUF3343 domain-containing protein [Peptostreptococcus sp. CBA3647]
MKKNFYILFDNHQNGLKLYKLLRDNSLKATISPTPRSLSKCCGISLIVAEEELNQVEKVIIENEIDIIGIESIIKDINPNRDRYC